MMTKLHNQELERRLSLYQVFLSLYERHGNLLDEILQLENLSQSSVNGVKPLYVQGVVDDSSVYVITNLCEHQTQTLQQAQHLWTIGRDRSNGICTQEPHLSRCHAAIQYVENQGFYLVDFNSTNGSFVNGEPVYQPVKLKDGDRIRLASLTFDFFLNQKRRVLPELSTNLLTQILPPVANQPTTALNHISVSQECKCEKTEDTVQIELDYISVGRGESGKHNVIQQKKSEILERFFSSTNNG
ncbi:FHA domain-containing protein [Anabaena sp. CA = ATCC 33047]|uniref:FHA domain-containing protein n=1 Tax=Anabaena sp. (strain CA / ATCC 33047) TaxID=52271 RepID=UPI00082E6313|nr:FHA domain-containing protein [Anabaena sp. CA = ATCC 33047]